MKPPCKGCEERFVGCHGRCEQYIQYRKSQDRIKAAKKLENIIGTGQQWPTTRLRFENAGRNKNRVWKDHKK